MELSPFLEESRVVAFDDAERLAGIRRAHVMVPPERGRLPFVVESYEHFAAADALHVDVGWLMLTGWRVDVDTKAALIVDFHHETRYNPALGSIKARESAKGWSILRGS
jgi:hypothetical protein